jgi:N-acetyl-alpha-D-muramate 1-phosphate uridylyltransferase
MTLPVAILAGGLATRLRPITERIPKALVDVAGEPFIVRQLRYLKQEGVEEVVLCIGHLGAQVEALIGDGSGHGLKVRYSWDGPTQLGTGGALRKALPLLGPAFFVFYGDSYLPIRFSAVEADHVRQDSPALMTVLENRNRWDRSNVVWNGQRIVEYNKKTQRPEMTHIDYGLAILSAAILEKQPADQAFDLAEIYHELSLAGQLAGHEVHERFYEIGSHQGLAETIAYFSQRTTA